MSIASVRIEGLDKLQRKLGKAGSQVPFAAARTITTLAKTTEKELQAEIRRDFNKPTPYIAKGTFSTSATKQAKRATIGMRDKASRGASPAQYVKESFGGGRRGAKPFEALLIGMGAMPKGYRAVPAVGLKLDGFGNPNRAQLSEVLGSLSSGFRSFVGRGKQTKLQGYFVVRPGSADPRTAHLPAGIWRRIQTGGSSTVAPVFLFVTAASYRKRIDLEKIARRVVKRDAGRLFKQYFDLAMRTAR